MMLPDLFDELSWRGLIQQTTDQARLPGWLMEKPRTVYAGFDPTADSLHVGHLLGIVTLRRFQQAGHRPIALVGGATGMVGDPSGKSQERNLLSREAIQANVAAVAQQLAKFFDTASAANAALLLNNYDWVGGYRLLDFLRDVGKHVPVNVMLTKESVRARLERSDAGLSYTEFSYMLLQAYDFAYLYDKYGCELQVGGSDQWGNITAGIDLARRMHGVQLYGITWPLLTKSDGGKMGKTESGTIWLAPERTSPYHFYQYWINLHDADVPRCLRYFTNLDRREIDDLLGRHNADPAQREGQRRIAAELTRLVHGADGLAAAERATEIFFGAEIHELSDTELLTIFHDVPSRQLPRHRLADPGLPIVDALFEAGLANTKSQARRIVTQGGAYVNNRRVESLETMLGPEHLAGQTVMVLRSGKKRYALLRFQ